MRQSKRRGWESLANECKCGGLVAKQTRELNRRLDKIGVIPHGIGCRIEETRRILNARRGFMGIKTMAYAALYLLGCGLILSFLLHANTVFRAGI